MEWLKNLNLILRDYECIIAIISIFIAIIGIITGIIGAKQLSEVKKIRVNSKIKNSNINNNQTTESIQNTYTGVGVKDAEYIASKLIDEKTKHKPNIYTGTKPPENAEEGSIWIKIESDDEEQ